MVKTVKRKPLGWTSVYSNYHGHSPEDFGLCEMAAEFLDKLGVEVKLEDTTWPGSKAHRLRVLVHDADLVLSHALVRSTDWMQFEIDKCRASGGDPRTLEECIAFCGTSGSAANIFIAHGRPVPEVLNVQIQQCRQQ